MTLSTLEKLAYSTIRIECTYKNGKSGTGTGFFFDFHEQADGTAVPVIITNKHVVKDAVKGRLIFSELDSNGFPVDAHQYAAEVNDFNSHWVMHPHAGVDLCAMPIAGILRTYKELGKDLMYLPLSSKSIKPASTIREDIDVVEEVLMIGYPNGLWDEVNNKPIFRRGITATHPLKDYLGRKEFMIDAACFPGSSGSPVFIYKSGLIVSKGGGSTMSTPQVELLGVLYAGPQMTVTGQISVIDVPTVQTPIATSKTMINLGFVIKAERIMELEKLFPDTAG